MYRIYEEQKRYHHEPRPFNYMPDDVLYRLPWFMGDDEPPLRVLYPILYRTEDGREVFDLLNVYIGTTSSGRLFAYNPRYVVNPLVLVVGTPGAGKSLHPEEEVLVVRGGRAARVPIRDVRVGDYVVSVAPDLTVKLSRVLDVIVHYHSGKLLRIKTASGRAVTVTPDHSVVTVRHGRLVAVKASELRAGDYLLLPRWVAPQLVSEVDGLRLTPGLGYVLGLYIASGGARIRCRSSRVKARLLSACREAGLECRDMGDYVEVPGLAAETRQGGGLPGWVFFSPPGFRRALLAGLLDGAGRVEAGDGGPAIEYRTGSRELADAVSLLLLLTGIPSCKKRSRDEYRVCVTDTRAYAEAVPSETLAPLRGQASRSHPDDPGHRRHPQLIHDRIEEIEEVDYDGPVYDISTEHETFMTYEGIFVHNSATLKTFIYNFISNDVFADVASPPPVIVVDPEGEYHVIGKLVGQDKMLHLKLGRRDYINIFDRPTKSINPFSWYTRMLSVIQKFLNLSPAQGPQAYRALKRAMLEVMKQKGITEDPSTWFKDDITLEDIYNYLESKVKTLESSKKMSPADRLFYQGANTVLTRIEQWMYPPNDAFTRPSSIPLNRLFDYRLVILDVRGLAKELFGIFSYWIVYWVYGFLLEKGPLPSFGVRVVLMLDEAWALLRKTERKDEENPLEALARRGRKYGILIVVATQTPEDVDEKMFSLFGTLVTGIVPSDKMVEKIVRSRGMPSRFKSIIKSLPRGTLVWSINWARKDFPMSRVPLIVHTDYPVPPMMQLS